MLRREKVMMAYGLRIKYAYVPVSYLEDTVNRILKEIGFIEGIDYFRQYPIPPYIADFAFPLMRLIIEVDGPIHDTVHVRLKDRRKDEYLNMKGWRVIRLKYTEIRDKEKLRNYFINLFFKPKHK